MEEAGSESFKHTVTELSVSDGEVRQKLTSLPFLCLVGLDIRLELYIDLPPSCAFCAAGFDRRALQCLARGRKVRLRSRSGTACLCSCFI